ncbi:MAG: tetratricopeptide repeat protein [Betaproteobacteria bacterium]
MPVPIDRGATLRNAEKLLRQGKLDAAIAEYVRLVEDQPRDWNTANLLGDLYVRTGQVDRGCNEFTRIADALSEEGILPKAAALYKKVLKFKPDHEHALVQSAEIAASLGLLADARAFLKLVLDRRQARGDQRGVAQVRIRLGSLDPDDFEARFDAARARAVIGDAAGALSDLKEIADDLSAAGRQPAAVEALREAAVLSPDDSEVRERLMQAYLAAGDLGRARECATTAVQLKALATALDAAGSSDQALAALCEAARLDPDDVPLRAQLARTFLSRGDMQTAADYLTAETAGADQELLLAAAELRLLRGETEEALAILKRMLDVDRERHDAIALLAWNIADRAPEAAYAALAFAADTVVAHGDFGSAAAALQEFVTRVPNHVPALQRLIEICVDGRLEATLYSAQAQLADAYLSGGAGAEARVIAEDLVAREPWERANIERFRRALLLLGEADPDAVIAERLSGQSPFTSTDPAFEFGDPVGHEPPPAVPASAAAAAAASDSDAAARYAGAVEPTQQPEPELELSFEPVDLTGSLVEPESFDLTLNPPAAAPPEGPDAKAGRTETVDLEAVFARLRGETSAQAREAEGELRRGVALQQSGRVDEAIEAFQAASRFPGLRFVAASLAGRLHREQQRLPTAIEWLERAAQAPAPTAEEYHDLLYELADLLEGEHEVSRALAILLELQAEAGAYRDVSDRIERLTKVRTRG